MSTHVCFRLKLLTFVLHSIALVPCTSGSHVPPHKKALYETSSWTFYLSPRLRPVSWALAWKKEEWRIIFMVEDILCPKPPLFITLSFFLSQVYIPDLLLRTNTFLEDFFICHSSMLPADLSIALQPHPGVWNSLWMLLLNLRALLVWQAMFPVNYEWQASGGALCPPVLNSDILRCPLKKWELN